MAKFRLEIEYDGDLDGVMRAGTRLLEALDLPGVLPDAGIVEQDLPAPPGVTKTVRYGASSVGRVAISA